MFYNQNVENIYEELKTSKTGLSTNVARARIEKYGLNILPTKKRKSIIKIFLSEFKDPIVILLLLTVLFSFLAHEMIDALAILFIILVDVLMGTYEENKANVTAESLSKLVSLKTKVIRDGKKQVIDSSLLTIGDIVELESGDKISADIRIISANSLMIDESILTGESVNVEKDGKIIKKENAQITDQYNMLFAGTAVVKGRCTGVVVRIGLDTEIGKIADSLNKTQSEKSPLTIRVEKFSKQITILIVIIAIILTFLLISKNMPYNEMFLAVIALSVSAMPEGLPLALTMALTIASNKMAKQNVIVKELNAVESLGSCTVIASDKTGTLTVNEQTAKKIILPNGDSFDVIGTGYELKGEVIGKNIKLAKELALLGVLNNEATIDEDNRIGDSIDIAFLVLGAKLNIDISNIKVIERMPYESEKKYSAVFYEMDGDVYCTVKGSLEVVKSFCKDVALTKEKVNNSIIDKQNEDLAESGYRVITLASGKVKKKDKYTEKDIAKLTFQGMVGFIDPIRKEAIGAIKMCLSAGIKVLMITGDHPLTAFKIAKDLQLTTKKSEVTTGMELEEVFKLSEEEIDDFIKTKKIFTRVTPLQKLKIVESLKRQGEFVAVTGDGVNDAPALKSANIGVAMGSGTDIAKSSAKMIVIDDNFKSIVMGVKEGRCAYANIRKIIFFLISCGIAEVLFFMLAILFDLPMPLVAIQLLWLNVVTDGLQDMALSFERPEDDIMKKPPRSSKEALFDKKLIGEIAYSALIIGLIVFIIWVYLLNVLKMDVNLARGYIMALMVFIQNIHVFNTRSEEKSALDIPIKTNYFILVSVGGSILLHFIVMEVPFLAKLLETSSIPWFHLLILLIMASSILLFLEIYKKVINKNR